MVKPLSFLAATGLGASLMYYLDPDRGNRRRGLLRDQVRHTWTRAQKTGDSTAGDFRNRLYGTFAELRSVFGRKTIPDEVLAERVRSKLGRYVSHPSAIEVAANHGQVTLSGRVLADEVKDLLYAVHSIH